MQGCRDEEIGQQLIVETKVSNDQTVKKLLSEGANAGVRTDLGETPLVFTTRNNCIRSTKCRLEANADPMTEVNPIAQVDSKAEEDWRETPIY